MSLLVFVFLLPPGLVELADLWKTKAFSSPAVAFAPLPAPTPAGAILSDDFNDNLGPPLQTTTWVLGYLNDPTDPNTQVQETAGQLHVTPLAGDDFQHGGYLSTASYNFTGGAASVEVVQTTNGGGAAETYFYVGIDFNNWLRIVRSGDGNLYFQIKSGGVVRRTTLVTYNNLQHRRWRIRHNAGSDSIYFETSVDGTNWTVRDSAARPFSLSAVKINLAAGVFVSTPLPGEAIFDNFLLEPEASFAINDVSLAEGNAGDASYIFTVTRTGGASYNSTVDFATSDNTATTGDNDYQAQSGTLNFGPSDNTKQITVLVTGDAKYEANEGFTVHLSDAVGGSISDADGTGTITNDDNAPGFSIDNVTHEEGNAGSTSYTFNVTKTGETAYSCGVNFQTQDGTATSGDNDYRTQSGTLSFAASDLSKQITVLVPGDTKYEGNETFTVDLSNPTNAIVSHAQGVGTVTNDDAAPVFTIDDVTHDEGNAGTTAYTFTVTRTGGTAFSSTVDFATQDGTATAGDNDYQSQTGTLTFGASDTTKQLTILVDGDTKYEGNEAFTVHLSNATNATIGNAEGVGAVTNDDSVPSLSINDVAQAEGNASQTTMVFTASLTNPSNQEITVHYATADGLNEPATGGAICSEGIDYVTSNGTLTFNPGETTKTISVSVCGETVYEPNEIFTITLDPPTNATISDASGLGNINNDDAAPVFTIDDVAFDEGNAGSTSFTFTVTRTGGSAFSSTVEFATQDGTATSADTDYQTQTGTLTFAPADTTKQLAVLVTGDTKYEGNETFTVHLSSASNATIGDADGLGTITNDDSVPGLTINDVSQVEGNSGQTAMVFTAALTNPSSQTVTVHYATANGTTNGATGGSGCTEGADYVTSSGTLSFNPGETSKTISIGVCGEAIYEANEIFTVNLDTPTNATVTDAQGLGTITNDDTAPVFTVDDVTHDEGNTGTTSYTFTVTRTGGTAFSSTVDFGTQDGTATTSDSDYQTQTGTLSFAPSDTTKQLTVLVTGDTKYEANESFTVHLSNSSNATISDADGVGAITNDDNVPALSINDVNQTEGNSTQTAMIFTVALTNPSSQTITVHYATANGMTDAATGGPGCADGVDYVTSNGTLTFNQGETTKTISVPVCGETIYEPNEILTVTLDAPVNATISDAQGMGTITNDDSAPVFTIDDVTHDEGNAGTTSYTFTVTRTGGTAFSSTVDFATQDGTATSADSDYQTQTGTLTFSPAEISKQLTVLVTGDTKYESNEAFTLHLSNASNATIGDADGIGAVTNDDSVPRLNINDVAQTEGNNGQTAMIFTVALTNPSSQAVTVHYATANGTTDGANGGASCSGGIDYVTTAGTLTFNPAETTRTINVGVCGDAIYEANETFTVTLDAPVNATIVDAAGLGTISNDDTAPVFTIDDVTHDEGNAGTSAYTFTVTRAGATAFSSTVDFATQDGTATSADGDYQAQTGTLTFSPADTSKQLTVQVTGDLTFENDEFFTVHLSNATNATISDADGLASVTNDDTDVSLTVTPSAVSEDGATNLVYTFTRQGVTLVPLVVNFSVSGRAAFGTDYTQKGATTFGASSGTATLDAGKSTTTVTIDPSADPIVEADEDVTLTITAGAGYNVASPALANGTITNDEGCPATLIVNDLSDTADTNPGDGACLDASGKCTLRAAINEANALTTCASIAISFSVSGTIQLNSGELAIDHDLTITGSTTSELVINGNHASRVLTVHAGRSVRISDLTISGGNAFGDNGGGIRNLGTLTLTGTTLAGNAAANGGAIQNEGTLTCANITVSGNVANANGGGIFTAGPASFTNVTVTNNRADNGNGTTGSGGGLSIIGGPVTLRNAIVARNFKGASPEIGADDVSGVLDNATSHNNLIGDGAGMTGVSDSVNGNHVGNAIAPIDPRLSSLANHGGGTPTHALLVGSPALDAGENSFVVSPLFTGAPFTDQRGSGFARIAKGPGGISIVDIGGLEAHPSIIDISDRTTNEGASINVPFSVGDTSLGISSITATSDNTTLLQSLNVNNSTTATPDLSIILNPNQAGQAVITVTVNGTNGQSMSDTFRLTVNAVNDTPSFTKGADQAVIEDSGPQTITNWATHISSGPNEAGQGFWFQITGNSNPGLFLIAPAVSPAGTLTYTPAANVSGSATITLVLKDEGGTASGGQDTSAPQSFIITVNAINDAPSFTKGADQTVGEDAGLQTLTNWATGISAGPNESGQTLSFQITGNSNPGLFAAGPAVSATGTLTYAPTANASGNATISLLLKDDGGTSNGGVDTSAIQTFSITVNAVNDAPSFTKGADQSVSEDAGLQTVTNWATAISAGPDEANQTLSFQITGISDPALFSTAPTVSSTGTLTYTPAADANGSATITLALKDDGGTANGGQDRSAVQSFLIVINPVNDAPVNSVPGKQSTNENTPLVLCAGDRNRISVSDVDAGENNVQVNLSVTHGTLTLGTTAGVTLITGDGLDDVAIAFKGTIANINLALEGLKYKPDNGFSGAAALQITTDDLEQCGSGGPQTASDSIPITVNFVGGQFKFSEATYSVVEGDKFDVTITRTGDAASSASVVFATGDQAATQQCSVVNGAASSRCDFETRLATVRFAPGETAKTVSILVVDDSYLEGPETFNISLSNAVGASLAPESTATITISDNDSANGPNPLDAAASFVRQHYFDFLNREPDATGLQFWTNEITSCGPDPQCIEVKRINVSAAFFLSIEFQETGYLIERIYKSSFGDTVGSSSIGGTHQVSVPIIRLNEFLADTQEIDKDVIVGQPNWREQLETNKRSFMAEFVQRERFTKAFPSSMTPAQFVDQLFLNAGVTPTTTERQAAIDRFGSATDTSDLTARAVALRDVAENSTLTRQEMNRAFVLMEYFGYLRRNLNDPPDSDFSGYDFWLTKLNQFNGNYLDAEMVKAFITANEYRQRLGGP